MPTYKRYVLKDGQTVYFFTKKPFRINDRSWVCYAGNPHPLCCLQEHEADFDFSELAPNQVIEVEMKITIKEE